MEGELIAYLTQVLVVYILQDCIWEHHSPNSLSIEAKSLFPGQGEE